MHKRLINQCLIGLEISTEGPMLIKSGSPAMDAADASPVVTIRSGPKAEPYIPGSSLKGVIRSHAERVARTLCWEPAAHRVGACNPFLNVSSNEEWTIQGSCGAKIDYRKRKADEAKKRDRQAEDITTALVYRESCPACKIFGNTHLIGRLSVPDAYMPEGSHYNSERRDGVGIDRFTGGSFKRAKFDLEAITNARFEAQLKIVNFELWHLGLLAFVLRDLSEGLLGIGSGKSRGLGQVSARISRVQVEMAKHCLPQADAQRLWGLFALDKEARDEYGYREEKPEGVSLDDAQSVPDTLGLRARYEIAEGTSLTSLWSGVAGLAIEYFEQYKIPEKMRLQRETKK